MNNLQRPLEKAIYAAPEEAVIGKDICESTRSQCLNFFGSRLIAIVLTGSLARDEASIVGTDGGAKLLGDAEFLLVFAGNYAPTSETLNSVRHRIESDLQSKKIQCSIDLGAVRPSYFKSLPPHIFTYELKRWGRLIYGDNHILRSIPEYSVLDLSREDAFRLLCNRMIEQLALVGELTRPGPELSERAHYATVKFYLDMATSYLVFAGAYGACYRERANNLRKLAEQGNVGGNVPFPLVEFCEQISKCTNWKISSTASTPHLGRELWEEAVVLGSRLWHWEVAQMTEATGDLPTSVLYDRLTRQLKLKERIRGWASAVRRSGVVKGYQWVRWARLWFHGTPRYLVYRAGTEFFLYLPSLIGSSDVPIHAEPDWVELGSLLPDNSKPQNSDSVPAWQVLIFQILKNYKEFVITTRA